MMLVQDDRFATREQTAPPPDARPQASCGHGAVIEVPRPGPWIQIGSAKGFEWNRVRLPVPDLPAPLEGFRILHITDLHLRRRWLSALDEVIRRVRSDPPDLLLMTGDYVEDKVDHRPALPALRRFLSGLTARLGIFGVLGNHDGERLAPRLAGDNITLIDGRRVLVGLDGAAIELIGVPGPFRDDVPDDFADAMPPRGSVPRIVLSHYPDMVFEVRQLEADLFLAGHTHGGQVCLPGQRPIFTHTRIARRLCSGVHRIGRTWFVANRGIGFSNIPIRLFCPAEVVEIRLTNEPSKPGVV